MKALKACLATLAVGTLLVGCSSEWSGEVDFKVLKINPAYESMGETKPSYVNLEIDQEQPGGIEQLSKNSADLDQFPEGIKVGDLVVCSVRQSDQSGFDQEGVQTVVGPCRLR
ncbi:hypothetical protein B0I31_10531 [Saccharothrix carnea]|uniref:Uncharacterized protein n=1 Tax=Saccharothrix carnea TaxID=1280637 RepID=A0A2P8I9E2_SACCR|nr:hypothetical protein [Saccharothrix carnea]PSL55074.1 hypothetical protein B0I31_10531 [Saccharothrix carnea]